MRRRPEILDIELPAPIVVIGLPRSGTTHLVNLIAADTRRRSLPYWESLEPCPLPGDGPGRDGVDPRFARCQRDYEAQMQMVPLLRAMHHQYPTAIEEEIELEDVDFASYTLEWYARVPAWRDFYFTLDQTAHYAYLKKVLQVLTFLRGPEPMGVEVAAAPRADPRVARDVPGRDVRDHAPRSGVGDHVGDHDARVRRSHAATPRSSPKRSPSTGSIASIGCCSACVRDRDLLPADRSIDVLLPRVHGGRRGDGRAHLRAHRPADDARRPQHDSTRSWPRTRAASSGGSTTTCAATSASIPADVRARFDYYFERFAVAVEDA